MNDKFDIQGINSTKINILIYLVNNNKDNKSIKLFDYSTVQVIYNDNIDTLKSDINKSNISSNLEIIDTNKSNISSNLGMINTNKSNISSNLEIISTNKSNISNNLEKIDTNKNNISNNLGKIDTNKSNISSNLGKLKESKQNKIYLKNISYDIFYNKDTQINFSNDQPFFEKEYNILFRKNDFIEIYFRILLNYVNNNHMNYVKSLYKILNGNTVLYERIIDHSNYSFSNNYLTIDEKFFYNFNEDIENIKFTIKFEMTELYVIRLFYNKRNNNRLILKHFGN